MVIVEDVLLIYYLVKIIHLQLLLEY